MTSGSTPVPSAQLPTTDLVATRIAGRFELLEEIGHGGMGEVWSARDHQFGRRVAIKMLRVHLADRPEMLRRFEHEARTTSLLQHPGIVPVHETGRLDGGIPYFVMKEVRGKTLRERKDLRNNRARIVDVFLKVCQTVAYAHSVNVIHRDLKPDNIMVGKFGEVLVMDWGIARVLDPRCAENTDEMPDNRNQTVVPTPAGEETQAGRILGTCAYMSPEQANGEIAILGPWSDVFSLGSILCEILTGAPAYIGNVQSILRSAMVGDVRGAFTRLAESDAEPDLIALARKCLDPDPAKRFQHAGQLTAEVEAFTIRTQERLRDAEIDRARAETQVDEERKRKKLAEAKAVAETKRRRATMMLAVAVLLLVIGAASVWIWQVKSAEDHRQESAARRAELNRVVDQEIGKAEQARTLANGIRLDSAPNAHAAIDAWRQGIAALDRAETAGATGEVDSATRRRLDHLRNELDVALVNGREHLERIQLNGRIGKAIDEARMRFNLRRDGRTDLAVVAENYASVFLACGVDVRTSSVQAAVTRLKTFPADVQTDLALALDDWSMIDAEHMLHFRSIAEQLDPDAWRSRFRQALSKNDPRTYVELAAEAPKTRLHPMSVLLLGSVLRRSGAPTDAIRLLREAQRQHPGNFWIHIELSGHLISRPNSEEQKEGVIFARIAVALRPESPIGHSVLCACYHHIGMNNDSVRHGAKAIELDPKYAPAYHNLGSAWNDLGNLAEAERIWQAGVAVAPENGDMHSCLSVLYQKQKKFDLAIQHSIAAVEANPKDVTYHTNLGRVYRDCGRLDEAYECFERAVAIEPKHAAAHYLMGAAIEQKDLDKALRHLNDALALEPNAIDTLVAIGAVLYSQRKRTAAIEYLQKAVRLAPDNGKAHFFLGKCYDADGEWEEMMRHYRLADESVLNADGPATNIAHRLSLIGDLDDAARFFRRSIKFEPDNPIAYFGLGRVLLYQGSFPESRTMFATAIKQAGDNKPLLSQAQRDLAMSEFFIRSEPRLAEILSGSFKPNDAMEGCFIALLCFVKNHPAAAAKYYAAAFARDPRVSDGSFDNLRLLAIRAAARAGTAQGIDSAKLSDAERTGLRSQARNALRDLIKEEKDRLERTPSAERGPIRQRIAIWQRHVDLAAIREAKALEKFPEAERAEWKTLWNDVEALRKKTDQP